uniref:Glycine-rich protein n=1 Tax=Noccaea caerulescens TaxID=107243 RepID=A0A1J3I9T7_NOCCA
MQRGGRDPFNSGGRPFGGGFGGGSFGGPNGPPNPMSSFFGGRNPFDDPFFTQPFGGMLQPNFFGLSMDPFAGMHHRPQGFIENNQPPQPGRSGGPVIEEIDSDDETEGDEEKKVSLGKHGRSSTEEEETEDAIAQGRGNRQIQSMNVNAMVNNGQWQPQTRSYSFQSSTVTYGGHDGNYYTSSKTRRTGSDGLTLEESKEANTATREAAHKISRGLHNKGHTVARKLKSDGRVDTTQTLHNLEEDELADFEQTWSGNARMQLPGRSGSFGSGVVNREQPMLPPSTDPSPSRGARAESSRRTKAAMNVRGKHGRN